MKKNLENLSLFVALLLAIVGLTSISAGCYSVKNSFKFSSDEKLSGEWRLYVYPRGNLAAEVDKKCIEMGKAPFKDYVLDLKMKVKQTENEDILSIRLFMTETKVENLGKATVIFGGGRKKGCIQFSGNESEDLKGLKLEKHCAENEKTTFLRGYLILNLSGEGKKLYPVIAKKV